MILPSEFRELRSGSWRQGLQSLVTSHLLFGLSIICILSLLFFKEKPILIELDPNQEWKDAYI